MLKSLQGIALIPTGIVAFGFIVMMRGIWIDAKLRLPRTRHGANLTIGGLLLMIFGMVVGVFLH